MNLVELLSRYRGLFYRGQSWYDGEAFTRFLPTDVPTSPPIGLSHAGQVPPNAKGLYRAVDLATCYVRHPSAPVWRDYLWCADVDALGQRVYLGGTRNGHGLEIHRHLHITDHFGRPAWR